MQIDDTNEVASEEEFPCGVLPEDEKKLQRRQRKIQKEKGLRALIRETIINCRGVRSELLVSNDAFEAIIKHEVNYIRDPSQHFVDLVMKELYGTMNRALEKARSSAACFNEFSALRVLFCVSNYYTICCR